MCSFFDVFPATLSVSEHSNEQASHGEARCRRRSVRVVKTDGSSFACCLVEATNDGAFIHEALRQRMPGEPHPSRGTTWWPEVEKIEPLILPRNRHVNDLQRLLEPLA